MKRTVNLPGLSIRAAVAPATVDEEKRTVDITWTTGARVKRGGLWSDPYLEELEVSPKAVRMDRLNSGAPLLDSHNGYDLGGVIGVVESAKLENGRGTATVRFARDPAADLIFGKVKDGIVRNVSVGYRVHKMVKVEDGADQMPVMRAVDWEPYEISMVPMPADAGATVRSGAGAELNPCEVVEERNMDPEKHKDSQVVEPEKRAAEITAEERKAIVVAERARTAGIHRTAKALKTPEDLIARGIGDGVSEGMSEDAFRKVAMEEFEKRTYVDVTASGRIEAGEDERDKFRTGVSAWIIQRAGVAGIVAEGAKKRGAKVATDPGEFRGLSLIEIARMCLERAGVRTGGKDRMEIVGLALTRAGMNTTSDFPYILENVLHKTLLGQYAITPDTWSQFCMTGTVSDFRAHKRHRLGSLAVLAAVNEAGEFAHQSIPDAYRESIAAATKGNIIAISRQSIINDDMGAFSVLATMFGRAARLTIEKDVYALLALNAGLGPALADGNTLFHASHSNIATGAALSAAALYADSVYMASQLDPSSNELLDLRPSVLLVPKGLEGAAKVINSSQYEPGSTFVPNLAVGLYDSVVGTARLTGTRRYSFAAASIAPVIEVAFLDGQQEPFMEMQNGFDVDGVRWKVRLDFAVGAIDSRGAVTNAGV